MICDAYVHAQIRFQPGEVVSSFIADDFPEPTYPFMFLSKNDKPTTADTAEAPAVKDKKPALAPGAPKTNEISSKSPPPQPKSIFLPFCNCTII